MINEERNLKIIAIIPARYNSSRFPGKPLAQIAGKPMIQWVYENTSKSKLVQKVIVATDDDRIYDCVKSFGGIVTMTSKKHSSGTERITEVLKKMDERFDIVLNIQGDEPVISKEVIEDLIKALNDSDAEIATLKKEITDNTQIENKDIAKVITDANDNAVYFSRLPIPYLRNDSSKLKYYKHIGVYAYRCEFFKAYPMMNNTMIEEAEQLEQLRFIYYGYKIKVHEIFTDLIGVDRPEHITLIEKIII